SDVPKWRRMARTLGQAVALQRLAIDEDALVASALARPETSAIQEYEPQGEQRVGRARKPFTSTQERDRQYDGQIPSGFKRRQNERDSGGSLMRTPAWQSEGVRVPARSSAGPVRDGYRGADEQSNFARGTAKPKASVLANLPAHPFVEAEPQRHSATRKPHAAPTTRARRAPASKRFAGR
ncbi:MAG: hypothetical protein ACREBW_09030, partial [Candidatus Micrarchaeaceae archaeon]